MNTPLDRSLAEQMASALYTINNITQNPNYVKQPDDEIKLKALKLFLSNSFVDHASEFLGSWMAVANEYEPLVHSFAALQRRAAGLNAMRIQKQQEQLHHAQAQAEEAEEKKITLSPGSGSDLDPRAIRELVAKAKNIIVMPSK